MVGKGLIAGSRVSPILSPSQVFVFKTNEQVIATFDRTMDEIMAKIDRIEQ